MKRLFIGYGLFAAPREINEAWAKAKWAAWFDGRRTALRAFGTSDRTLYAFPPAGGKDVTLREWRVMLTRATPGRRAVALPITRSRGMPYTSWLIGRMKSRPPPEAM